MDTSSNSLLSSQITYTAALAAIQGALLKATELTVNMSIAVVDNRAMLVGFLRMDGAFLISPEIAQKKARCAASLGFSPEVGDVVLENEHPRVRQGLSLHPDYIEIRGGLPIIEDGMVIGAIGISGGSEEQDLACAKAGIVALGL